MSLALFDMDGTLIDGDTNDLSLTFFLELKIVTPEFVAPLREYARAFFAGTLDIGQFVSYIASPFVGMRVDELDELMRRTARERILPKVRPGARQAILRHKACGDIPVIVTSTVDYLTLPVAAGLGIEHCLCARMKRENGVLTQESLGPVPYQEMKVKLIEEFAARAGLNLEGSCAYGDSINDLPMLRLSEHPVAVNPQRGLLDNCAKFGIQIADWGKAQP